MIIAFLIIALTVRIIASCVSSILQKQLVRSGHLPIDVVAGSLTVLCLLISPVFVVDAGWIPQLTWRFWSAMFAACAIDAIGNVLLVRAMGHGDLSIIGPLNSYKPFIGLMFAFFWLGEIPNLLGLIGLSTIVVGSWFLMSRDRQSISRAPTSNLTTTSRQAIRDRFGSLIMTSVASVFLKDGMQSGGSLLAFAFWAAGCAAITWLAAIAHRVYYRREIFAKSDLSVPRPETDPLKSIPDIDRSRRPRWQSIEIFESYRKWIGLGVSFLVLQAATIYIFQYMPVGYALALFQLGSLAQVYIGWRYFAEEQLARRMIASSVMAMGAVCVVLAK